MSQGWSGPGVGGSTAVASDPGYPVVAGLDAPLEVARWRVIGNAVLAIPHLVVLYAYQLVAQVAVFVAWFAILFTGRMPGGLGAFVAGAHRYQWRVQTYALFLREQYPAFGAPPGYGEPGGDPAWLRITPPGRYSRLAVFFRIVLVIPQALYGIVATIVLYVAWIVGFFAVLITGRWPEAWRRRLLGAAFWSVRVNAWYSLLSDPYPPFEMR